MAEVGTVDILRLGAHGDGVADATAGELFVPYALPGERWRIDDAGVAAMVEPLADRQSPRCPHFTRCGGCSAQHMPDAMYRDWKRGIVVEAFGHRGLDVDVEPLMVMPPASRRRAVFALQHRGRMVEVGFHAASSHTLEPIEACAVLNSAVLAARAPLAELGMLLLKPDAEARATVLASDTGLAIDLAEITFKLTAEVRAAVAAVAERHRLAEVSLAGDPLIRRGAPRLTCGGAQVVVPPGIFTQAVAAAEEEISRRITNALGKARHVADLFSGIGPFAFAMARQARVAAFDSDARAIAALVEASRHAKGLKPIAATVRDLVREPLGRKELDPFDAVVLDPPRAGAKSQTEALAKSQVPTVVMVSCNPATLARDCRILVDGGYSLDAVTPIDQFLWSAHVEAVVVARRSKKTRP